VDAACGVFLGDTMGELPLFYAASDVAFVGGTLVPVGGHNLLEPAALGLPVVTGPHLFNTQDIADMFLNIGALTRVADAEQLAVAVTRLLQDKQTAMRLGNLGRDLVVRNRGALDRLLRLLEPLIARQYTGSNREPLHKP
jgi:3-deoxy-D-manno-octulosonic-acid transferase